MRLPLLAFLLSFGLTLACKPPASCVDEQGRMHVGASTAFSQDKQASLLRAEDRWNAFAGHEVLIIERTSSHTGCFIEPGPFPLYVQKGAQQVLVNGLHSDGHIIIADQYRCAGDDGTPRDIACFEATAMHELGHVLNIQHTPNERGDLMSNVLGIDFTDADKLVCRQAGVCK